METVQFISGEFERIHENLPEVLEIIPEAKPFESPKPNQINSCGESIGHTRNRHAALLFGTGLPKLTHYPDTRINL